MSILFNCPDCGKRVNKKSAAYISGALTKKGYICPNCLNISDDDLDEVEAKMNDNITTTAKIKP